MNPFASNSNHSRHKVNRAKKKWLKYNLPDEDGNYICGICEEPVKYLSEDFTLDHIIERVLLKNIEEFLDEKNLQPAHKQCNFQKNRDFTKANRRLLMTRYAVRKHTQLTPEQRKEYFNRKGGKK